MKLNYETAGYARACLSPCPVGKEFRVGSFYCVKKCEHFLSDDKEANILDCKALPDDGGVHKLF